MVVGEAAVEYNLCSPLDNNSDLDKDYNHIHCPAASLG
jgi:hypothetical protein